LRFGFTGERRLVDGEVRRPQRDAIGGDRVAFSQHKEVARHDAFNRDRAHVRIAHNLRGRRRRLGQPGQRGVRACFEHDVHAQHRNQSQREHHRIPRLTEHEVNPGGNRQHDRHRIEEQVKRLTQPRPPIARYPAIRAELGEQTDGFALGQSLQA
jgi:hypothetical protein